MELGIRLKEYFKFNKKEVLGILVSIILIAFILSFKDWGTDKFDVVIGLNNFFGAILVVGLCYIIHISVQKIYALKLGYVADFHYSLYGLIAGLVICFASNGYLFFLGTGEIRLRHMARMRVGAFRYGLNYWDYAKISFGGVMANMFLAVFFKLFSFTNSPLIEKAVLFNILIAIFSMIPVPYNDGINIFFGSKLLYIFGLGTVAGMAISLLFLKGILLSIILGFFIGVFVVSLFFIIVEQGLKVT